MDDFEVAAGKLPMSLAEADLAIQKFYGQVRGEKNLDGKAVIVREMANSAALKFLSEGNPFQAANLLFATLEYLPACDAFNDTYTALSGVLEHRLQSFYPEAAQFYRENAQRLASELNVQFDELGERFDKERSRYAWQLFRRSVLSSYKDLSDEDKLIVLEKTLASAPLLTQVITPSRPWEALDILSTFVEICPEQFKAEFAQKYFFGSQVLTLVNQQCPEMADVFIRKVSGFLPTPQVDPAVTPQDGSWPKSGPSS
jgi:hypothetical protein